MQSQGKIIRLGSSTVGGEIISTPSWILRNAKQVLSKKLTEQELDNLCKLKSEIVSLELENLQGQQAFQVQQNLPYGIPGNSGGNN